MSAEDYVIESYDGDDLCACLQLAPSSPVYRRLSKHRDVCLKHRYTDAVNAQHACRQALCSTRGWVTCHVNGSQHYHAGLRACLHATACFKSMHDVLRSLCRAVRQQKQQVANSTWARKDAQATPIKAKRAAVVEPAIELLKAKESYGQLEARAEAVEWTVCTP